MNKHRRLLVTSLSGSDPVPEFNFPHIEFTLSGPEFKGERVWAFLTIQDGYAEGIDITVLADSLARYVADEVLPLFKDFFE